MRGRRTQVSFLETVCVLERVVLFPSLDLNTSFFFFLIYPSPSFVYQYDRLKVGLNKIREGVDPFLYP